VALPTNEPVVQTLGPIAGDNTANIQNAINAAGNLSPNGNGLRGVVLLNPGAYEMDGALTIAASGVVLRGSGNSTNGTVLNFYGTNTGLSLNISGSSGANQVSGSSTYTITNAYVPLGATSFGLNSLSGLSVGTSIIISRPWTQTWIDAIGMSNYWTPAGHQNNAERAITAINGNVVTVDIALPTPIEQEWTTGVVYPCTDSGRVQQCGVEDLCMVSIWGANTTGDTNGFGWTGVQFGNCKNCWARDLAFVGYGGEAINASGGAKWCTAQDCTFADGVNNGSARPGAFQIEGQMCLFQRLTGVSGFEHLLQSLDEATGPNVFLYCNATGANFDGGPHRYWAVSLLTDNEYGDIGNVHIVIITGGDNGWGAGYSLFYNCDVNNYTIQAPDLPFHYNWWIGGSGENTDPSTDAGTYDAAGTTVAPASLYLEQLKERLGAAAVRNIGYQPFTIAAAPPVLFTVPGSNAVFTVTLGDPSSMSNTVALSVSGLPAGAGANFSANSVAGAGAATLTVTPSNTIAPGTYNLNIIGISAGLAQTSAVTLVVGDFLLAASPASQTILPGGNTSFTLNVVTNTGFSGSVVFGVGGLPAGASPVFTPPSVSGSGSSTLSITTTAGVASGAYPLTITGAGAQLTNSLPVTLVVNPNVVNLPGPFVWNATNNVSADTNWSSSGNWSPAGPPGPPGQVEFYSAGAAGAVSNIDNVVNVSYDVAFLQFASTNGYHTTLIEPGRALNLGGLTVGTETDNGSTQLVYGVITGSGGALNMTNASSNLVVRQGSSAAGSALRATLDLSGLDNFTAALANVEIGTLGALARPSGTLYLARTNMLTASGPSPAIQLGGQGGVAGGNGGNGSFLYLGLTNAIFANGISVATVKQGGCSMLFNPAFTNANPTAYFRNADGVSPVPAWSIADSESAGGTINTSGTNDFTGGTVNALVGTLTLARSSTGSGNGNPVGVLTFSAGTISAGTINIGLQGAIGSNYSTGVVNVNGTATLIAGANLALASVLSGAGVSNTTDALNINGGTVLATNIFGGGGVSVINLNTGVLNLQGTNAKPGQLANVSALAIGAAGSNSPALLENAATLSVSNTITVASNGLLAGNTTITASGLVVNGAISPGGGGVGAITNSAGLTFGAGGSFYIGMQDALAGPGVGWDFLKCGGNLAAQGTAGNPFTLQLQTLAGGEFGGAANFNYNTNYNWIIATAGGGLANFSAAGFAVNDALFQNDLAGGYFYVTVSGNSLLLVFTNNQPPVASPVTNYLAASVMTIPVASLAPHWSDPNGDPVTLALVNANSAIGTNNVSADGTSIYYTNLAGGADVITYLVQDVRTNPPAVYRAEDTVQTGVGNIYLLPPPAIARAGLSGGGLAMSGGGGIPGGAYSVLASTNLALPLTQWQRVATNSFDSAGDFQFTNAVASNAPAQFFLLQAP